jgi:hypothetical protein
MAAVGHREPFDRELGLVASDEPLHGAIVPGSLFAMEEARRLRTSAEKVMLGEFRDGSRSVRRKVGVSTDITRGTSSEPCNELISRRLNSS